MPVARVDVVPTVCESVVGADPVVLSEVSAGSIVADGPTPNLAAKELKSVAVPKPKVASKASKSGSDAAAEIGVVTIGGNVTVLVLGAVDVVVPPNVEPEFGVENCACATHGVAISATGASHPRSLFIPPPCLTLHVHIDHGGARVVPRGGDDNRTMRGRGGFEAFSAERQRRSPSDDGSRSRQRRPRCR